jgi:hypothetical protein
MRLARVLGVCLLLIYISAESLLKKDNQQALRSAEEGIDKVTKGKLAQNNPNTYFGLLSTLSLIGVFAPVALYLKKYHLLLTMYLFITRWKIFFASISPFNPEFSSSSLPGNHFEEADLGSWKSGAAKMDFILMSKYYSFLPPPFVLTTLSLALIFLKETIDSFYEAKPPQLARVYDGLKLKELILDGTVDVRVVRSDVN